MKHKHIHLCMDIEGGIRNASTLKGCITVDGHTLTSVKEIRAFLQTQLDMGRKVLPMGDCDNFDYQTGCRGHEVDRRTAPENTCCIHDNGDYCEVLSDESVKQPCIEGPCPQHGPVRANHTAVVDTVPFAHAKWEHLGGDEFCCTACGHVKTTDGSWETPWEHYCPNCGARMEKPQDER